MHERDLWKVEGELDEVRVVPEPGPDDPEPGLDHPWGRRPPGYWAGPDAEELNAEMGRRIDEKRRLGLYPL